MNSFHKIYFFSALFILLLSNSTLVSAQQRKPLHQGVYDSWKAINNPGVSQNGQIIHYELNPQYGDGSLILRNLKTQQNDTIPRAYGTLISADESFAAFKIKAPLQSIRKAKLDGKKKEDLPLDSLGVLTSSSKLLKFAGLKSFAVPSESGNILLAMLKPETPKADTAVSDTAVIEKKPVKKEKSGSKKDKTELFTLNLIGPEADFIFLRERVTLAELSDNGKSLVFVISGDDSLKLSSVWYYDVLKNQEKMVFSKPGVIKNLNIHRNGEQFTFMHSSDTIDAKRYSLHYYNKENGKIIADTSDIKLPEGNSPGEHGKVYFSHDGSKLYFGIAKTPRPQPKDTLTDDEKAKVDIWHYRDQRLQTQQLKQLEEDRKKTLLSVFHTKKNELVVLGDENTQSVNPGFRGDGQMALGFADEQYLLQQSWSGKRYRDIYLINNLNGSKELLLSMHDGPVSLSNGGNYLAWYSSGDSLWCTMTIRDKKTTKHKVQGIAFYDESHDVPGTPGPEGSAGWTYDDKLFMVYDKYDMWGLSPDGKNNPVNITGGEGRKTATIFRNLKINSEVPYIGDEQSAFLVSSFNKKTKKSGYCRGHETSGLWQLLEDDAKFGAPIKSKNSETVLFTRSDFNTFPDLWLSDLSFGKPQKVSEANPQQADYLWGSVELYDWISTEGDSLQGLLYKPEGFDQTKQYPMLVYFYEKYTDQLHQHYAPRPSRSIISPTYCVSNGYVVFIPDINYTDGYPGQSSYESVVSGTLSLISEGFIDKNKIGIQGQSWGGYQVAWLITRTNLFKAAMAGAPVSNMTSAYGGIRWESGMVRQFQYEAGQSRIGANLWERPDLYIENSPLFRADKIETPLLIMSNDGDGAVPWYQGIELFTAMRRLQKPVWMLNYNNDEHNLKQRANMMDLDKRMMQFFDHYLKDAPAPEWLKTGVPALEKGKL
ncbi:MAG: peptidase S9 prolyl oligopeptidase active site domain-containing [Bacteroidetes bacterium]|nr:MAG: peptidase S9 prolyl oligopeptidase active site domain-containing [Bacteroidota bacterium]